MEEVAARRGLQVRQATPEVERRIARRAALGIVRSAALSSREGELEQQVYGATAPALRRKNGGVAERQVYGAAVPGQHAKQADGAAGPKQNGGVAERQTYGAAALVYLDDEVKTMVTEVQQPSAGTDQQGPPPTAVPAVERSRKRKRPGNPCSSRCRNSKREVSNKKDAIFKRDKLRNIRNKSPLFLADFVPRMCSYIIPFMGLNMVPI